ncbi:zinc finger protein 28 homolog isoform X2 [Harpegnathos saltator]|uniref:zinc finger protein 28 homolog isoform X2 n=1 Tax=Harpegnathos saltator TaxID=610380 RepID=UPI000DBEDACD|nr:zinc finger protein 28 homolog isoform X2 [Harpegnathos saltator]XP_025160406.1 zinc finger protein 28 homolog isoform X2 [Harpegnathos saltator]
MSSADCSDLCRLCLVKERVTVPIFEGEGDARRIFTKISTCLPVKISREDKLPQKLCADCVYKVETFFEFWQTTAVSEKRLQAWLADVEKQDYAVATVLNQSGMKGEQSNENRLDGSGMMQQVSGHQNSLNMVMDNMGMCMSMMMPNNQQQITSVPMDPSGSSVQSIQVVAGSSTHEQITHDQIIQNQTNAPTQQEEEEESSEDEENSDDECDGDGLPIKEESEEDPNNSRTIEPTTFVNVSLACEDPGPSGLQQQKMADIQEMTTAGDPKTGYDQDSCNPRGIFIFDKESVVMKKWQILEFDGKPYYAFVPEEEDMPLPDEEAEEIEVRSELEEENANLSIKEELMFKDEVYYDSMEEKTYNDDDIFNGSVDERDENVKSITLNGINEVDKSNFGDVYQVKVQGSVVTLEKLVSTEEAVLEQQQQQQQQQQQEVVVTKDTDQYQTEGIYEYEMAEVADVEYLEDEITYVEDDKTASNYKIAKVSEKTSQSSSGTFKCRVCSEMFDSDISFRKHVAWTHKKKVCIKEDGAYICAVCDYRTLKKSLFATHLERKHETWSRKRTTTADTFPCVACGFVCRSKHSLQSHFIRKHTDRYEHHCNFCSKKFKVKGDLTNHIRFHHKEKPVKCDVCGKLCMNSGSLYVHQKWAHFKPKYECHICKRRMVTQENLDQHLLTQHEQRDKIVCAECGKTFTKKDSFKRHMVVHTGCKPHICLICSKPFARRSQLRQHLLIHTGKRPFVCDICGKAFTQKPGLICHRKTHPGPHPPLPVMPIADIVKEFTEGYVQEINARVCEEKVDEVEEA